MSELGLKNIDADFEPLPTYSDLERDRIEDFSKIVPKLLIEVQHIEVDENCISPKNDARERFFQTRKRTGEPLAYLAPEFAGLYTNQLNFNPNKSHGGKASRHGVIFGDLNFGNGNNVPVAIKPFAVDYKRATTEKECLNDYFGNSAAYKLGVGGLQPVGIVDDAHENFYSLTVLQRSLDTFDNIDWSDFTINPELNIGMQELWNKAAHSIAVLHSMGDSYHGDLFLRNLATNPEGNVFPIDWEYGDFSCIFSKDLKIRFFDRFKDLANLAKGMVAPINIGIESGAGMFMKSKQNWWILFQQIFYTEYRSWRMELASQGKLHMKILESTKSELEQLDIDLETEITLLQRLFIGNA